MEFKPGIKEREDDPMKRRRLAGALTLVAIITVFGLAVPPSVTALEKVQVCLPEIGISFGDWELARKVGYYEKEGLSVDLILMSGAICERALLAGSVDFSLAPNIFQAFMHSPRGKIILQTSTSLPHKLIANPQIKSIQELKGKKIATSGFGGLTEVLTREILQSGGLNPEKDTTFIVVGTPDARYAALTSGAVQASLLASRYTFMALDAGYTNLKYKPIPYVSEPIGVLDKTLKERQDLTVRFTRATMKGHIFFKEKPEQSLPILMKWAGIKTMAEGKRNYEEEMERYNPDGILDDEALKVIMDRANRGQAKPVPASQVFDFSIARNINADLKKSGWKP